MADTRLYLQTQATTLYGAGAVLGATSVILSSLVDLEGNTVAMTDLGTLGFGTIAPGASGEEEATTFTGITQNANGTATLTGVKTQLGKAPYTQTSGLLRSHAGGTIFVLSNTAGFYDSISGKNNDETITGIWTFTEPNYPRMATTTTPPITDGEFATKKYADDLAILGSPKATETVYGISKLSSAAADPTAPVVLNNEEVSATAAANKVPKARANGELSSGFTGVVPGMIAPYAGSSAPTGWLLADGSAVSRATYDDLFAVVSTLYGYGDNSTTFNLPNLKNRIAIGLDITTKVVIDNCDAAWTAGANVTASNDTGDKKQGTGSVKLVVDAAAGGTQILGYKAITSMSLAGKTRIGMWIKSSINLTAGDLKYQLDDTAALASVIESIDIPALSAGIWTKIYLTLATPALDTAIISHGIYQVNDKGAFNLWIDDVNDGENYELGATGGEKTHVLAIKELAAHTHLIGSTAGGTGASFFTASPDGAGQQSGSTGNDFPHNNLQPYIALNYIIKY